MAEKQKLAVFSRTEPATAPADNSDLKTGNVRAVGVGLRAGEIAALDAIAAEYGISRGAAIKLALRLFIIDHRAGRVNLSQYVEEPEPAKNRVRLPG